MKKIRTADCVEYICNSALGGRAADWKRRSKKDFGESIIRIFENVVTGQKVEVLEYNGRLIIDTNALSIDNPPIIEGNKVSQIKENPVIIDLKRPERMAEDFSGRVIYDFDDQYDLNNLEGDEFGFFCGPETTDGGLDDRGFGCENQLMALFADFGDKIMINDAENYHTVYLIPGISAKDLWKIIEKRLKRSGAVLMKNK